MKQPASVRCLPLYPVGAHVSTFIDGYGELPCTVLRVRTQRRKYAKHYRVEVEFDDGIRSAAWVRRADIAPGWPQ